MSLLNTKSPDEKKLLEEILKRETLLEERRIFLDKLESELKKKEEAIGETREELTKKLQNASKLTADEAKHELLKQWEHKLQKDISEQIIDAQAKAREQVKQKAREIFQFQADAFHSAQKKVVG